MLILARKVGERVHIGEDIEIVVLELKGETVRLGISAPRGVPIYRHEIYEAIRRENVLASQISNEIEITALSLHKSKIAPKV